MSFTSSYEKRGGSDMSPDYIFWNGTVISNTSSDLSSVGVAQPDLPVKFNETRDSPFCDDVTQYHYSINRFTVNGPGINLPILIPSIQLGQSDVDLTTYSVALTYQQTWDLSSGAHVSFAVTPPPVFIRWSPECRNPYVAPAPALPLVTQDITTRYYYLSSYNWFMTLVNTALTTANQRLYDNFKAAWLTDPNVILSGDPFPYPTLADFNGNIANTPQMSYDSVTGLFSLWMDSRAYGPPLSAYISPPGPPTAITNPQCRLFFNTNMFGLFSTFPNIYWNQTAPLQQLVLGGQTLEAFPLATPPGYTYEMLVMANFYQNVVDYRLSPFGNPGDQVPTPVVPIALQQPYYQLIQEYPSTSVLWSPIESIVFTSTLLPIRSEQVAAPTLLGTSSNSSSAATSASNFSPIITDIALDTTAGPGAGSYRQFISYVPSGEYRMADFCSSQREIREIDIQIYFKMRLTGELIPMTLYNLSSVSIKLMLRHKRVKDKSGI